MDPRELIGAVAEAAREWRDPDHPERQGAVEKTLAAKNRFTEEAIAFAVNQQMSLLTRDRLEAWLSGRHNERPLTVGVLNPGNVPMVGLQDFLAVALTGHRYTGTVSSKSPYLLPAFVRAVRRYAPALDAEFAPVEQVFERAEAVVATGNDETREWAAAQCTARGIDPERTLLRGNRYAVAVTDGMETEDERENLAEDALLHEGLGCRNVAIIWAPAGLSPDPVLDAFAAFRGVFPAHADTPGALKMQKAFLAAVGIPYAYGDGLEFLVSKGDPEVQAPGHLRWVEYQAIDEVDEWLAAHAGELQLVIARPAVAKRLATDVPVEAPGHAQRPELSWCPDGIDIITFLSRL